MRLPMASMLDVARTINNANLPDTAIIRVTTNATETGGFNRPSAPVPTSPIPCRCTPVKQASATVATQDVAVNRYVVVFAVGQARPAQGTVLELTSAEFGWTKLMQVDGTMDKYTNEVAVKVYCEEI